MKIKNVLPVVGLAAILVPLAPAGAVPLPGFVDTIGNSPIGSDPVSGVVGSGSRSKQASTTNLSPETQSKLNAVGATLTASSLSGSQTVGGNTVNVSPEAAQTAVAVIDSPAGADIPALSSLTAALGGGGAAQQLARSMQGLRGGDGSINPVVLSSAVRSYNDYLKYLIDSSQVTQKPTSELNSYVEGLPPAQKAAQVILGKLVEAAR